MAPTVSEATSTWGRPEGDREASTDAASLQRGTTLGRYVLLGVLGHGGMGAVYSAWDTQLERRVALKLLHAGDSALHAESLFAEARALAQLRHANVVAVHDVCELGGFVFLAMDLVEGPTLRPWVEAHPDPRATTMLLVQCARGLAAVHRAGLLHRDVKPSNVVVEDAERGPRPVLVDFGLAVPDRTTRVTDRGTDDDRSPSAPLWAGTPAYLAPECLEGDAGPRSDQWSFALTCAELLTGTRPSRAECREGRLAIRPAALRLVIARGLHGDPALRWPDLDAMADAIEAAIRSPTRRRWIALGVVSAMGATLALATTGDRCPERAIEAREAVWNPTRAAEAHDRLARVDPTLATTFTGEMERWSQAWESSWAQLCGARQLDSAAAWCLEDDASAVGLVVAVASAAEDDGHDARLFSLTGVLPRLRDPATCMGPITAARPRPTAAQREQFVGVREGTERAAILELLGRYDEAAAVADDAWAAAAGAPALLRAPIAQRQASIAGRRGALETAEAVARAGMELAAEAQDDWLVATIALDLLEVLTDLGRVDELRHALQYAGVAVKRAGDSPALRARLEFARGRSLEVALDGPAALEAHRRALEIRQAAMPESIYVADSQVNVAALAGELGQLDEAMQQIDAALASYRALLGEAHPTIAHACVIRALTLQRKGTTDEALAALPACIAMFETTIGPDAEEIAFAATLLGMLHANTGDHAGARAAFERALAVRLARLGPDHPETGIAHTNLGSLLATLHEDEAARRHLERARSITLAVHGERSPRLATILSGLGQLAANAGDDRGALANYEQALALHEATLGPNNPGLLTNLVNLGELATKLHDPRAESFYARCEAILDRADIDDHPLRPLVDLGLGRLHAGTVADALAHLDAAVTASDTHEVDPGLNARARFARAKLWADDPIRRADAVAEARLARTRLPEGVDPAFGAEIDAWLVALSGPG